MYKISVPVMNKNLGMAGREKTAEEKVKCSTGVFGNGNIRNRFCQKERDF